MAQLDLMEFFSQLSRFAIIFTILFFYINFTILPMLVKVLKYRSKKLILLSKQIGDSKKNILKICMNGCKLLIKRIINYLINALFLYGISTVLPIPILDWFCSFCIGDEAVTITDSTVPTVEAVENPANDVGITNTENEGGFQTPPNLVFQFLSRSISFDQFSEAYNRWYVLQNTLSNNSSLFTGGAEMPPEVHEVAAGSEIGPATTNELPEVVQEPTVLELPEIVQEPTILEQEGYRTPPAAETPTNPPWTPKSRRLGLR